MSFKNEIEAIVGDIDSPDYTSQVALYLAEGVKFITKYVMNNFEMVEKLTSSTTLNNSPTTMDTSNALKIISVTRNDGSRDRVALQVPSWKAADYTDANSIYYTSKLDPKWYISNGTLNVIPTPASGQSALVKHITPDTSVAATDASVDNFPSELERGIVLYASKEMLRKLMSVRNTELPSDMTIPTLPTAPALLSLSLENLGTAPGYTQTVLNLTSAPSISALSISVSAPSAPTLNTVSYIDASNADASATAVSDVSVGSVTKATITNNLPTYIPPTVSLTSAPSISDLSISASAPSAPTLSDTIIGGLGTAPTYTQSSLTIDYTQLGGSADDYGFDDLIAGEDVELAQTVLAKHAQQIQKYQTDVQNNLNEFNEDVTEYQADLQRKIEQARIENSEDNQLLQKYQSEIQVYSNNIQKEVQQYQANLEKEITLWTNKRNTELSQYQADIQNNLNSFNEQNIKYQADIQAELAEYQGELQRAITKAQMDAADAQQTAQQSTQVDLANKAADQALALQNAASNLESAVQDNNKALSDYQAKIQSYQAQVSTEVQEYSSNLERELQLFSVKRNTEIAKYQADMQDELNKFNKELQIYQTDLSHKIKKADLTSQEEALSLQKYSTELESYGVQINKEMQNFATKLQKITTDYQWLQGQYTMVTQDLLTFLQPYLPAPVLKEASNEITAND